MPSLLLAQLTVNWSLYDDSYYCGSTISLSSWGGNSGFVTPHHISHLPLYLVEFARVYYVVGLGHKTIRGLRRPLYPRDSRGMRIEEPSEEG